MKHVPSAFVSVSESTLSYMESKDVMFRCIKIKIIFLKSTPSHMVYYAKMKLRRKCQKKKEKEEATRLQIINSRRSQELIVTTYIP